MALFTSLRSQVRVVNSSCRFLPVVYSLLSLPFLSSSPLTLIVSPPATLIALVIASLGIAWRSFLIRRRFHTRVREALVRGESFPGMEEYLGRIDPTLAAQSRRNGKKGKKMLGPVPMLYEALGEDQRESAELARTKLDDWEGIMVR
jgi:hypothetical protein